MAAAYFTAAKFLAPVAARSGGGDRVPAPSASYMRSPLHRARRRLSSVLAVSSDVLKAAPAAAAYPAVTREEALELYEDMILGRNFEDMCAQMYYRGKMFGFVHLYNGQEAVSTGFIKQLNQPDCVVSTYRDHVHALSKGVPARAVMAELFGKATGCCRGQGGSMHMFSEPHNLLGGFAFIGEGIPVATGAAFAAKYRHEVLKQSSPGGLDVTLAFFGDGTCNNGQFFAAAPTFLSASGRSEPSLPPPPSTPYGCYEPAPPCTLPLHTRPPRASAAPLPFLPARRRTTSRTHAQAADLPPPHPRWAPPDPDHHLPTRLNAPPPVHPPPSWLSSLMNPIGDFACSTDTMAPHSRRPPLPPVSREICVAGSGDRGHKFSIPERIRQCEA